MTAIKGVCCVAGAGPGVGFAVARKFAQEGFAIALVARRQTEIDRVAGLIAADGGVAKGYAADLSDAARIPVVFDSIKHDLGAVSVLVYNAALWRECPSMDIDPALFGRDLALSVTGALACAQAVYPAMKTAGAGSVLFTGGGLSLNPQYGKGVSSLTAGKSALRALTFVMAEELRPDNVHVATVTIAGQVEPGGAFDPARIAERYWQLHCEPPGQWSVESVFRGD